MSNLVSETDWLKSLPDPARLYPVLINYTERHVAKVEARMVAAAEANPTCPTCRPLVGAR